MIEDLVRARILTKITPKTDKSFYRLVLGEFNRINDGKPIDDDAAIKVLKKMIKSNLEMIKLGCSGFGTFEWQNRIIKELMPVENIAADMDMLIAIENSIPDHVSNKIRHMKPCLQYLEDKGFTVDKKRLSEILRSLK